MKPQAPQLPLRDIHLPEAVSWWPPAIGWWLLLALLILLALLLPRLIRRLKRRSLKKLARQEFDTLVNRYQGQPAPLLRAVSAFMRQLLMSYRGRENNAALTGDRWINELQSLGTEPLPEAVTLLLKQGPYQASVDFNEGEFIRDCRHWLDRLPASRQEEKSHA